MKRNLLLIALALSLLFNVFVLIGFARARSAAAPPLPGAAADDAQVEKRIARELNLNPQQEQIFSGLRADHRQQTVFYDESIALLRQNLLAELRKENPDLEKVRELVNQESEMYKQRRLAGADLFGRFVGELTPQQRREMIGRFLNMRGPHGNPPAIPKGMMERFDKDKDGRLDPDEMRRAQQEMERRRRDMPRQGPPPPPPPR